MAAYPFLSELRIFPYSIVPKGWAICNGQLLPINRYTALFSLLGTTYGGDGRQNFALPDLRGRVPMHRGTKVYHRLPFTLNMGNTGGEQTHVLSVNEIPKHTHQAVASAFSPDRSTPENNFWTANSFTPYGSEANNQPMAAEALQKVGENAAHNNMAPFLVFNICIALEGLYPSSEDKPQDAPSDQWTSEIRMFAGGIYPQDVWQPCDGQTIPISDNSELFGLIGTNYGGDGVNNVGMPNLQASAPLMAGNGDGLSPYEFGEIGGVPSVTLIGDEIPQHTHAAMAKEYGNEGEPEGRIWANPAAQLPLPNFYSSTVGTDPQLMNGAAFGKIGEDGAHNNLMPFGVVLYRIATHGTYPPR